MNPYQTSCQGSCSRIGLFVVAAMGINMLLLALQFSQLAYVGLNMMGLTALHVSEVAITTAVLDAWEFKLLHVFIMLALYYIHRKFS